MCKNFIEEHMIQLFGMYSSYYVLYFHMCNNTAKKDLDPIFLSSFQFHVSCNFVSLADFWRVARAVINDKNLSIENTLI